jgi:hypothetical protein
MEQLEFEFMKGPLVPVYGDTKEEAAIAGAKYGLQQAEQVVRDFFEGEDQVALMWSMIEALRNKRDEVLGEAT